MKPTNFFSQAFRLYYDGFRQMKLGRTLWLIIIVKLLIIFVVLRIFFFPNFLRTHAERGGEADYVSRELLQKR